RDPRRRHGGRGRAHPRRVLRRTRVQPPHRRRRPHRPRRGARGVGARDPRGARPVRARAPVSGPLPRRVLHVMNNPVGGSAASTLALLRDLAARRIESAAVCHATGPADAMAAVEDAVDGRLLVTRLWWWNRRTRAAWWRRPVTDARESLLTGRGIRSA